MNYDIPGPADELARWQAGAISREQLLAAGLTSQMITTRLERGRWQQLHRGVYAVFSGPPSRDTWLWAAVLRAGHGAVLSHQTAAELHGLIDSPVEAIFVTVPSARRVKVPGIAIRFSGRVAEARQPNREPARTTVEETVLDLVQLARTFDDACGWLEDVLAAAGDGIHSVLEYRYLRDVERAHGLPASRHQHRVVIDGKAVYRDAYYEEFQVAVELDGRLAHPADERWRDSRRDNMASAGGVRTCRYTWRDVYGHPCETALLQARILRQHGWQGTIKPCSARCPVGRGSADLVAARSSA